MVQEVRVLAGRGPGLLSEELHQIHRILAQKLKNKPGSSDKFWRNIAFMQTGTWCMGRRLL